jgi:hypothetical protein
MGQRIWGTGTSRTGAKKDNGLGAVGSGADRVELVPARGQSGTPFSARPEGAGKRPIRAIWDGWTGV